MLPLYIVLPVAIAVFVVHYGYWFIKNNYKIIRKDEYRHLRKINQK